MPRLCVAGQRAGDVLRRLPGRVPLRQAWPGFSRKARARPVQRARLPRFCRPRRQLDAEPVDEPRPPAAGFRRGAAGR